MVSLPSFSLKGRVALVTGASSGLGEGFARALAESGAFVWLAARRVERLEALKDELLSQGFSADCLEMDVTSIESVDRAFEILSRSRLDVVVNNSGMSREALAHEMEEDDFEAVLETNLTGVWRMSKAAARQMIAAGTSGSIVNIGSITASGVTQTLGAYSASKSAVAHLTRTMALELARYGIRVNAIAPGYFRTEINDGFFESEAGAKLLKRIPMRRTGEIEELFGALVLLASDAGRFMTGSTIVVDGGHTLSSL